MRIVVAIPEELLASITRLWSITCSQLDLAIASPEFKRCVYNAFCYCLEYHVVYRTPLHSYTPDIYHYLADVFWFQLTDEENMAITVDVKRRYLCKYDQFLLGDILPGVLLNNLPTEIQSKNAGDSIQELIRNNHVTQVDYIEIDLSRKHLLVYTA